MSAKGYATHSTENPTDFKVVEFPLKSEGPKDVTIAIECCGVCGSDVHTITGGWGPVTHPCIVGHEIIGKVTQLGEEATGEFKVGDRVGVGAQVGSCGECEPCRTDNEMYCDSGMIFTYQGKYETGERTQGGYSTAIRCHENFVFKIPDALSSVHAAPLMCAGLTVYSPLKRNGCGPGKKVGIVGIGGLGHLAVQFAKAMGAEVYALTHSEKKKDDIFAMGASHMIMTTEKDFEKKHFRELDLILSTVDKVEGLPLDKLSQLLKVGGAIRTVGLPDANAPLNITSMSFLLNQCTFGSSLLGSKKEANEMLALAAEKGVKPWVQELPMSQAKKAIDAVLDGSVRYRYVLHNDIE